jgi:hypothetical protein
VKFTIEELPRIYSNWRNRYAERDERMSTIDAVVQGEYAQVDPEEDAVESRSPNLIQVALEDTAEAASMLPTIRVSPARPGPAAKKQASQMEQIAAGYFDISKMDLLITSTVMDLAAFGIGCWVVWPDTDQKMPFIEWRDPRNCFPEPGLRPGDNVKNAFFARVVYLSQLPEEHQQLIFAEVADPGVLDENVKVTLVEWFDCDEVVVAALYENGTYPADGSTASAYTPIELERWSHNLGVCPVIIGARFSLDGEFRGQFDQVVGSLLAHVRLMGMVLDYADQAVYSDVWVRDLIGEMPYGGGAYIELGPQGAIGRVPPAVTSLNVVQDLQMLTDNIHVGGRWPKSRPGEIDQSIASAKFLEATAGMMNTAIKTYHSILRRMMEQALRVCFLTDKKYFPGKKVASGVLRNQEFVEEYETKDIDLKHQVRVEYGLGLGRDPAQSAVLMLQYAGQEYISKEWVQENIEGLTDVAREQSRIDVEKLKAMALAKLLQGIETGTVPDAALVEIAEKRAKGEDLFSLFRKYVVEPQQEQLEQQMTSGLGAPVMPGMGPDGAPMPGEEAGMALPPPPPEAAGLLARLGVPAGPGGLLGAQQLV